MIRLLGSCVLALAALGLTACGEKPQTAGTRKADTQAWQTTSSGNVAPGWKQGDHASWEEQLRNRAQGQNDYAKVK
jgi:hypothetical protein